MTETMYSASPDVYTGRWQLVKRLGDEVTPVRISRYPARFLAGRSFPFIDELAPTSSMLRIRSDAAFDRQFLDRLAEPGMVDRVQRKFTRLLEDHGKPLMLCCFEDLHKPGEACHRQLVAKWWAEQTGGIIADLQHVYLGWPEPLVPAREPDPEPAQAGLF